MIGQYIQLLLDHAVNYLIIIYFPTDGLQQTVHINFGCQFYAKSLPDGRLRYGHCYEDRTHDEGRDASVLEPTRRRIRTAIISIK